MGINLGALIAPLSVAWFRAHYGWSVAFGSAAVAMLFSLLIFTGGRRHLGDAAERIPAGSREAEGLSPGDARSRVLALLAVFVTSAIFWIAFYQNGFTLTLWARDNTVTSMSPESFQSVEPLGVMLFSASLLAMWTWMGRRGIEPSTPMKMLFGILLVATAFVVMAAAGLAGGDAGRVSVWWLVSTYVVIALGEVCQPDGAVARQPCRAAEEPRRDDGRLVRQPLRRRISVRRGRRLLEQDAAQPLLPARGRYPVCGRRSARSGDAQNSQGVTALCNLNSSIFISPWLSRNTSANATPRRRLNLWARSRRGRRAGGSKRILSRSDNQADRDADRRSSLRLRRVRGRHSRRLRRRRS